MKTPEWPGYSKTRYSELGLCRSVYEWRWVDLVDIDIDNKPRTVGPHYKTKTEALADLDRYAAVFGCVGA